MRFPELPWMVPTFDLLKYLGITKATVSPPPHGSLIDYVMSTKNNISFFNGVIVTNDNPGPSANPNDPFNTGIQGLTDTPDGMAGDVFKPFIDQLNNNWETGWKNLMAYDVWSTRDYMALALEPKTYSDDVRYYYSRSFLLILFTRL